MLRNSCTNLRWTWNKSNNIGNKSFLDGQGEKAETQKTWSRQWNNQSAPSEGSGMQWWWLGTHTLVLFYYKEFIKGLTSCLPRFKYKNSSLANTSSSVKHNYGLKVDAKNNSKELRIHIFLISVSIYLIATVKCTPSGPQDWNESLGGSVLQRCLTGWQFCIYICK